MADQTIEKTPMGGTSVNQPESGTYGEKADTARLSADLPPMNREGMASATGGPAPMPNPSVSLPGRPGGRPVQAPPGVPGAILGSENVPGPGAAPSPVANPQAARLTLLEQLSTSPEVSATTRQWAKMVLDSLRG
jgi:hypothetical protein